MNIKQGASLYCDSKGRPVPINIEDTVGCNLAMIEADYGLFIMNCLKDVHNVPPASPTHCYMTKCRAYYPWQPCSYMCGVIVICMTAVMSLNWDSRASWDCRSTPPIISDPSKNHKELRPIVMSWIIDESIQTSYFMEKKMPSSQKWAIIVNDSDDDFEPPSKKVKLQLREEKIDILAYESAISDMLPDDYLYTEFEVSAYEQCTFRVMIESEDAARKWVQKYNERCKETMVYERSKKRDGKRVVKKLFLWCQHKTASNWTAHQV